MLWSAIMFQCIFWALCERGVSSSVSWAAEVMLVQACTCCSDDQDGLGGWLRRGSLVWRP
eukprot:3705280-Rhodomonas_salina.1